MLPGFPNRTHFVKARPCQPETVWLIRDTRVFDEHEIADVSRLKRPGLTSLSNRLPRPDRRGEGERNLTQSLLFHDILVRFYSNMNSNMDGPRAIHVTSLKIAIKFRSTFSTEG